MLSQCDFCDRWFHPNCINAALVSLSATKGVSTFECPLCQHRRNKHSNFAYAPLTEWKVAIATATTTASASAGTGARTGTGTGAGSSSQVHHGT